MALNRFLQRVAAGATIMKIALITKDRVTSAYHLLFLFKLRVDDWYVSFILKESKIKTFLDLSVKLLKKTHCSHPVLKQDWYLSLDLGSFSNALIAA